MSMKPLPFPELYKPETAASWQYRADPTALLESAGNWRRAHDLAPPGAGDRSVHLLLIDAQRDFCLPEGSLYVGGRSGRGAVDDSRRTAEFIYRALGVITDITATFDTHLAFQVFFPSFWLGEDGRPPPPHTVVSAEDLAQGRLRPNPDIAHWLCGGDQDWLETQALDYCRVLEDDGKYQLYLWPPHCLLGTEGHALAGIIEEARLFHSFARGVQAWNEPKGDHPLTENYSVLRPEVLAAHDGSRLAGDNDELLDRLLAADRVIIAGQASSHCVKSTIDDLGAAIAARDPARANRVYILRDCMSAVAVPDGEGGFAADFTGQAEEALARYAEAGMHLVDSTTPIEAWPEFP